MSAQGPGGPHPHELTDHLIEKLRANYRFFSDMAEAEIVAFLRLCRQVGYDEGQGIFRQGDSAKDFFLVISGEVVISIREREMARLGPGHVFGEMSLLERIPRTASAAAAKPTRVFAVPAAVMSEQAPLLAYKVLLGIAQEMSERLRVLNAHALLS
jgi:CRP-like cAMP-binding protein